MWAHHEERSGAATRPLHLQDCPVDPSCCLAQARADFLGFALQKIELAARGGDASWQEPSGRLQRAIDSPVRQELLRFSAIGCCRICIRQPFVNVFSGGIMQQKRGDVVANATCTNQSDSLTNFGSVCEHVYVGDNLKPT
jgi:hypothetical protein